MRSVAGRTPGEDSVVRETETTSTTSRGNDRPIATFDIILLHHTGHDATANALQTPTRRRRACCTHARAWPPGSATPLTKTRTSTRYVLSCMPQCIPGGVFSNCSLPALPTCLSWRIAGSFRDTSYEPYIRRSQVASSNRVHEPLRTWQSLWYSSATQKLCHTRRMLPEISPV